MALRGNMKGTSRDHEGNMKGTRRKYEKNMTET
jgi:hypothetical protein